MGSLTPRYALALALLLMGSGCAVYRKCGFSGCPGDASITREVQGLFDQHPEFGPPNLLRVDTLDRVVYLTGRVATEYQRELAEAVARQARGPAKVVNSIALDYDGR
jgi:osmotically-inducible protein OsmY